MDIRIGKQLTQAREALGFVVEDVAHRTKIPAAAIRQLESEDYSHFPNNVYAKSFLRLYSKFLRVDPRDYLKEKDGQLIPHEDEVAFLEGIAVGPEFQDLEEEEPERKIPGGVITTAIVLAIGIPTAIVLSKLYNQGEDGDTAGDGQPPAEVTPAPDTGVGGSPVVPVDPTPRATLVVAPGGEGDQPVPPDTIDPGSVPPEGGEPSPDVPRAIPVEPEGDEIPTAQPVASRSEGPSRLIPTDATPVALPE